MLKKIIGSAHQDRYFGVQSRPGHVAGCFCRTCVAIEVMKCAMLVPVRIYNLCEVRVCSVNRLCCIEINR